MPKKNQAMKYYEALTKTVKWAEEFEEIENLNKYLGTILYTSPSKLTIYQGETEDISLTVCNKNLADLKNVTAEQKRLCVQNSYRLLVLTDGKVQLKILKTAYMYMQAIPIYT